MEESRPSTASNGEPTRDDDQRRTEPRAEHSLATRGEGMAQQDGTHQDANDTEADEKPSGIAEVDHAPVASVVNRTLRKGASAASALGEQVSKTASAVTPLASEVRKTAEAAAKTSGNIARTTERTARNIAETTERTALGIADRLTTVLIVCIQALWAGLAFTVVIVTSLAPGVGSSVPLFGTLLWALGAAFIAFTPRALRAGSRRRHTRAGSASLEKGPAHDPRHERGSSE